MNSISFTPNCSQTALNSNFKLQNKPAFQGLPKAPNMAQAKQTAGFLSKAYKLFFIPMGERIVSMSDGTVKTVRGSESCIVKKNYPLWSKKPSSIIKDFPKMGVRKKVTPTEGKKFDYEISDTHDPNYKISATYKGITEEHFKHRDYDGAVDITYCDKKISVSPEKRKELLEELSKSIDARFSEDMQSLLDPKKRSLVNFQDLYSRYHKDPEVIGRAILTSPSSINDQVKTVNTSLPHGLKCLIDKLG